MGHENAAHGLLRPISKRDLFEAFSSYRMLVGEEHQKVDNIKRLYAPIKHKSPRKVLNFNETSNYTLNRHSNNVSSYNLLKERGFNSLDPNEEEPPKPSPPIANTNH